MVRGGGAQGSCDNPSRFGNTPMSDALEYLVKVRPQAMQSYFAFLREAGSRLDPRTRALISVITKVDRQTERGFRQYVRRALREGVTAGEILDAMLLAFPTLGLSKVVWAVDILLAMDLPEFRPERLAAQPVWRDLGAVDAAGAPGLRRLALDDRAVFVHAGPEGIRVYDSRCPHQGTDIPEMAAEGAVLTCPRHGWKFDAATGRCLAGGDRPLTELPHRVRGG